MNLHFDISTGIAILCVFSSAIIALVKRRRNRKCASCGHVLSRPYNFCAKCGYKVSDEIFQSQDLDAYVKNKMKTRKRYFNLALATTISIPILPLAIMLFFSIKPHEIMDAAILDICREQNVPFAAHILLQSLRMAIADAMIAFVEFAGSRQRSIR